MNKLDQPYTILKKAEDQYEHTLQVDYHKADGLSIQINLKVEDAILSYALCVKKSLLSLDKKDFEKISEMIEFTYGKTLAFMVDQYQAIVNTILVRIHNKIKAASIPILGKKIVHTAPHHDDIILGYYSYVQRVLDDNDNYILYMTDGMHGVSSQYVLDVLKNCMQLDRVLLQKVLFYQSYEQLVKKFAQAFHEQNRRDMQNVREYVLLHIVIELFLCVSIDQLDQKLLYLYELVSQELQGYDICLQDQNIDILKGRLRQFESDCKWMIEQGHINNVTHFGASFYTDDTDTAIKLDVQNLLKYLQTIKPDIITVALDPCGVGPATHFTTLQVIANALQLYGNTGIEIIGYRNIWASFTISQTSLIMPVSLQDKDRLQSIFVNCFATQLNPLFPSPLHDGPFSDIAVQNLEQQGQDIALLLGQKRVCDYLYLKKLTVDELMQFIQNVAH